MRIMKTEIMLLAMSKPPRCNLIYCDEREGGHK